MGNSNKHSYLYEDYDTFQVDSIAKSLNPKVNFLFIDQDQYPQSGFLVVSNEKNYSQISKDSSASYKAPSKIITATFHRASGNVNENKSDTCVLVIALEDRTILFLHAKSLEILLKHIPTLTIENFILPSEITVTSSILEPFKDVYVDVVHLRSLREIYVGFGNGFIQKYSLELGKVLTGYNPLLLEIYENENNQANELKPVDPKSRSNELILENYLLPGIESLGICYQRGLLFVNHKKFFTNSYSRVFTFDETRIIIYREADGTIYRKLAKCAGSVQQYKFFSDRDLYIVLTSGNFLFVWNFEKNILLMKIPLMNPGVFGSKATFFTNFCVHEFPKNLKGAKVTQIFKYKLPGYPKVPYQEEIIDGDFVFCSEKGGGLMIGKITYQDENGEILWQPLKLLGMVNENTQSENDKKELSKQIKNSANNISIINYHNSLDTLYMIDQVACVRIFKNMLKNILKPTKLTQN